MTDPSLVNLAIKVMTWAASPLGALCIGLVLGWLIKLAWPDRIWGGLVMLLAVGQLIVWATPPVAHHLQAALEQRAQAQVQNNTGGPYQAIVLLGGMTRSTLSPLEVGWQPDLTDASDRAVHAAHLWHQGTAPLIIVSGGAWPSNPPKPAEALWIRQLLVMLGVPQAAILLETDSTTTRENMANVARLMQTHDISGRLAVVTSASHMPRALQNARRAGLTVDAYPTDWRAHAILDRPLPWAPNSEALMLSSYALKEWIALTWRY
jgi:uncharacterized SAM-binding protein YcdF (DUF218 family)